MSKTVAVVGGGIFGVTSAAALARAGHRVTLFEAAGDLLCAASGVNQYRLHRGYHYPRSVETAVSSRDSEASFREVYGAAVVDGAEHYYAIARRDTLTDGASFLVFLKRLGLEHRVVEVPFVRADGVELTVAVRESVFDPDRLRELAWEQLRESVDVRLNTRVALDDLREYDVVVVAVYAAMNAVLGESAVQIDYQFEVVEKPVVRPPRGLHGVSLVILDGPFTCIDPFGCTGLSVIGNVVHAIHHTNVGRHPEVPDELRPLLDRGVVERPPVTCFPEFAAAAAEFVDVEGIEHVGSMFTIRTVLPGLDRTDARPTVVMRVDDRLVTVFSGKIGTCVHAGDEVAALVGAA